MLAGALAQATLWRVLHGADQGPGYWRAVGTPLVGGVPGPVDALEAFAAKAREGARSGAFLTPDGLDPAEARAVLEGLGYQRAGERWVRGRRRSFA